MKGKLLILVLMVLGGMAQGAGDEGWISLFNGKDLTGWKANEGTYKSNAVHL